MFLAHADNNQATVAIANKRSLTISQCTSGSSSVTDVCAKEKQSIDAAVKFAGSRVYAQFKAVSVHRPFRCCADMLLLTL